MTDPITAAATALLSRLRAIPPRAMPAPVLRDMAALEAALNAEHVNGWVTVGDTDHLKRPNGSGHVRKDAHRYMWWTKDAHGTTVGHGYEDLLSVARLAAETALGVGRG